MKRIALSLLLLSLVLFSLPAGAQRARRVVVVLVPAATLEDMASQMPAFRALAKCGAVGLMNARTASPPEKSAIWGKDSVDIQPERPSLESAYLTLGAGARAIAGPTAGEAFNANETTPDGPAIAVFQRRTGQTPGSAQILHTAVAPLLDDNKTLSYKLIPGLLGESVRRAGLKTACLGNSDLAGAFHREVAALAMDKYGRVDFGDVGSTMLIPDPRVLGGVRTNPERLLAAYRQIAPKASLVVLETGDSARVDRYAPLMKDRQAEIQLRRSLKRADRILAALMQDLDLKHDRLIVLSPIPSRIGWRLGNRLSPIAMAGPGIEPGMLESPSTRRPRLVVNTDFAPTVIDALGVPVPKTAIGRPMISVPTPSALEALLSFNKRQALQASKQGMIPRTYIWVQVALLALTTLLLLGLPARARTKPVTTLLLVPVALPITMLLTGGIPGVPAMPTMFFVGVGALILSAMAVLIGRTPIRAVCALTILFSLLVTAAVFRRGDWIISSVYGYSASEGARYYGLGNEYMGYLVGAMGLLAAVAAQRLRGHRFIGLALAAVILGIGTVTIGFPSLGANSGGGIAAAACSAAAILFLSGARLNRRNLILIGIAAFAFLGGLVALDLSRGSGAQSHIGHAAQAIASGGWMEAVGIIVRKLQMNIKLLKFSPSSRLMLVALAFIIWLMLRLKKQLSERPLLNAGVQAILVGATAGFVFNDSGVLAAANTLIYAAALLLAMELEKPSPEAQFELPWNRSAKSRRTKEWTNLKSEA